MPNLETRLVIYDLDGTLVDSAEVVRKILNELRTELSLDHLSKEAILPWISLGGEDLISNALNIPATDVTKYLQEFRARYFDLPTPVDSIYDGVYECLDFFEQERIITTICTNKPRRLAEKVLNETGLSRYFEFFNAGGDLSTKKPHQNNLISCLDYYGVKACETILVGDSTVDQQLASNAAVKFAFYPHGYDDGVNRNLADILLSSHTDFINYPFNKNFLFEDNLSEYKTAQL